ncbi:MAG: bifunctional fucokinase/L-fucose-1-P-guanylyltransferase [Bacteroidales bacterium]|jgi:galactokinase/mevalonate kinase-like predicted kinase|nr:bifunctional fucokinase/L-fucose-1-P-guanylyltransferase [Bacteroidales bacterium]
MKYLLSVPRSLTGTFHQLTGASPEEWLADCDPDDARVGSGGGTAWLLYRAWCHGCGGGQATVPFEEWLSCESRMLIHAGGQSRRLPAYAPLGKILTPVPVFRWQRGQYLDQTLLDIQTPLYRRILEAAPSSMQTLVASGDVLITADSIPSIPDADVVCFGLWISPEQACNHGVFFCDRRQLAELEFMLQKPSGSQIRELAPDYYFLMDIGIWLLSSRAVSVLMNRCGFNEQKFKNNIPDNYDLYGTFGPAMGKNPVADDPEIKALRVKIVALDGGEFYHFGTGADMLHSALQIQNRVLDQRNIWSRKVKPHPSIFVQNAHTGITFTEKNRQIWLENACVPASWTLHERHIITGVPQNSWTLDLPAGVCIDMAPVEDKWCLRLYGFDDTFSGRTDDAGTKWLGRSLTGWYEQTGLPLPEPADIQQTPLFPLLNTPDDAPLWIAGILNSAGFMRHKWEATPRMSAAELSSRADVLALDRQRRLFRQDSLVKLAENYRNSVFYQLDLDRAAGEWPLATPPALAPDEFNPILTVHNCMFAARVMHYRHIEKPEHERRAFAILRETILDAFRAVPVLPRRNVYSDQIVWGRSPVRLDLAGGWTDTPPYCMIEGGRVVNVAVELNGQPPLQTFIRPTQKPSIVLRSIDLGESEELFTFEELTAVSKVGSAFAIPKAALMLCGFCPEFCSASYRTLEAQLTDFGGGFEITLLAAVPKGSGLGTSSILAATILGALSDFASLNWDKAEIGNRTLALEQLLTTGGGWQDQFGGLMSGIKCMETAPVIVQSPVIRWLPDFLFRQPETKNSMLLYYTGITRVAKNILTEIVRGMFLNSSRHLDILREMRTHAERTMEAVQSHNYELLCEKIRHSWMLNCRLDAGTNPPEVDAIIRRIAPYAAAWKLLGAGGGGYLLIMAKNPEAAGRIRTDLRQAPPNNGARFVDMSLSEHGFQVTRS